MDNKITIMVKEAGKSTRELEVNPGTLKDICQDTGISIENKTFTYNGDAVSAYSDINKDGLLMVENNHKGGN